VDFSINIYLFLAYIYMLIFSILYFAFHQCYCLSKLVYIHFFEIVCIMQIFHIKKYNILYISQNVMKTSVKKSLPN